MRVVDRWAACGRSIPLDSRASSWTGSHGMSAFLRGPPSGQERVAVILRGVTNRGGAQGASFGDVAPSCGV